MAGPLTIRIGNREMSTDCIVVPEQAEALVGQIVMERLDLIADPLNQTLGPRPEARGRSRRIGCCRGCSVPSRG